MLEGFAFLAARVHLKIDDEFPEITEALLNILYPHYIRPVPSMSVVQFHVDSEQVNPETGLKIERGAVLNSQTVGGTPCKFRTCYDTTFWPVGVSAAEWTTADRLRPPIKAADTAGAIRLELQCAGDVSFQQARHVLAAASTSAEKATSPTRSTSCCATTVRESLSATLRPSPKSRRSFWARNRFARWASRRTKACFRNRGARSRATG